MQCQLTTLSSLADDSAVSVQSLLASHETIRSVSCFVGTVIGLDFAARLAMFAAIRVAQARLSE